MKIYITRYSYASEKLKPCDEAIYEESTGRWFVDINSLEGLIDLAEKYQTLILVVDHARGETRIEIFDDWSSQA